MKKILANYKSPIIVLLCHLGLSANNFAWQYWLNPAGTIVGLPLLLILLFCTLSPLFSLFWKKCRTKKTIVVIGATLLAWVIGITVSRNMPNGVGVRLSQFSEQDFQEISGVIDAAYEKHRGDSDEVLLVQESESFSKELKESHAIFNLSRFPMRVSNGEDGENYKTIGWYGGMVGGHDVVIFEKGNPPALLREYRAVYIYDTVAYYGIEDYQ